MIVKQNSFLPQKEQICKFNFGIYSNGFCLAFLIHYFINNTINITNFLFCLLGSLVLIIFVFFCYQFVCNLAIYTPNAYYILFFIPTIVAKWICVSIFISQYQSTVNSIINTVASSSLTGSSPISTSLLTSSLNI